MITLKKILCPIDHSDCSKEALKYAVSFALRNEAELYLLHVIDIRTFDENLDSITKQIADESSINNLKKKLLECVPEEIRSDMKIEAIVVQGIPFVEIIRFAKKNEVDMLVLGTHGRTGLAHMMLGSVSEKVVRKAPCPVLTVRSPNQKFVLP